MSIAFVVVIMGVFTTPPDDVHSPGAWSPDGRWLAFVTTGPARPALPGPGWIYEAVRKGTELSRKPPVGPPVHRMYVTGGDRQESLVLEESRQPLSAPSWRPDGQALAYTRLRADGGSNVGRLEVVVREGLSARRVVAELPQPVTTRPEDVGLGTASPSWSADGRLLAVPSAGRVGFTILRSDNGRVLKVVPDGFWPVWSPDGRRIAYIESSYSETVASAYRAGASGLALGGGVLYDPHSLQVMDGGLGNPRRLAEIGHAYQAPAWSSDARWVIATAAVDNPRGFGISKLIDLIKVHVETGEPYKIAHLGYDATYRGQTLLGISACVSRDGEDVYYSSDVASQPTQIVWYQPGNRREAIVDRFNPVDFSVRLGGLSLSPDGQYLSTRIGPPSSDAPLAVRMLSSKAITPQVPDDVLRVEWLSLLVRMAREHLRDTLPAPTVAGAPVDRPTVIPVPGELVPNQEMTFRLARLANIGRPLCDRPPGSNPVDPEVDQFLREARLFFDVLRNDLKSAALSLDALETAETDPDRRFRLLSIRAQVAAGLGDQEQAADVVRYLKREGPRAPKNVEYTVVDRLETPGTGGLDRWAEYLGQRFDDNAKGRPGRERDVFGQVNAATPVPPDLLIDPDPNPLNRPFGGRRGGGFGGRGMRMNNGPFRQ